MEMDVVEEVVVEEETDALEVSLGTSLGGRSSVSGRPLSEVAAVSEAAAVSVAVMVLSLWLPVMPGKLGRGPVRHVGVSCEGAENAGELTSAEKRRSVEQGKLRSGTSRAVARCGSGGTAGGPDP